jgi:hypothetical protein
MKFIFLIITLLSIQLASAQSTLIQKNDTRLSQAKGKITAVSPICPKIPGRVTCMAYGSNVTLKVALNGCLDRLGGHFTKFEVINNTGVLFFSAINLTHKQSMMTRCVEAPFEMIKVSVPFEGEIELINLDYSAGTTAPRF